MQTEFIHDQETLLQLDRSELNDIPDNKHIPMNFSSVPIKIQDINETWMIKRTEFVICFMFKNTSNRCFIKMCTIFRSMPFENERIDLKFLLMVLLTVHRVSRNVFTMHLMDHYLRFFPVWNECGKHVSGRLKYQIFE